MNYKHTIHIRLYALLVVFFLIFVKKNVRGQDTISNFYTPNIDSLIISKNALGRKTYTYTLKQGETLYAICNYFGLKVRDIAFYNPPELIHEYRPGSKVIIPIPNKAIKRFTTSKVNMTTHIPVYYQVQQGDTSYGIATRDYKMPLDTLVAYNHLYSQNLQPGQILQVGWLQKQGIDSEIQTKHIKELSYLSKEQQKELYQKSPKGSPQKIHRGAAVTLQTNAKSQLMALRYNHAPVGSYVSIINPMNQRHARAKVIAPIQPGTYDKNIIAILTPELARELNAPNNRFFIEVIKP